MIDAYYRPSFWLQPNSNYIKILNYEYEQDFLLGLTPEEVHCGKQIYGFLIKSLEAESEFDKTDDIVDYYENSKNIEIPLKDIDDNEISCLLQFGNVDGWQEYQNVTHSFYAYVSALQSVQLKRANEEEYHISQGLTNKFEGLVYSGGVSIGDDDEKYSVQKMSPEFSDLLIIREGEVSPRVRREQIMAERRAAREEEERLEAEEQQTQKDFEDGQAEAILDNYYDKKYGTVTSKRSYDRKTSRKRDWDER